MHRLLDGFTLYVVWSTLISLWHSWWLQPSYPHSCLSIQFWDGHCGGSQLVHSKRKCVGIKSKLTELILCNFQMKSSMCHAHPTRSSDASYKILQAQLEGIDGGSDEQWTWLAGVVPSRDAGTRSPAMCGLQLRPVEWRWCKLKRLPKCNQMQLNAGVGKLLSFWGGLVSEAILVLSFKGGYSKREVYIVCYSAILLCHLFFGRLLQFKSDD